MDGNQGLCLPLCTCCRTSQGRDFSTGNSRFFDEGISGMGKKFLFGKRAWEKLPNKDKNDGMEFGVYFSIREIL
jgi:hypothetical protein